jgi:predicted MPP superfamily phosphohydrolase
VLALAGAEVLCAVYASRVEPYCLSVTGVRLCSEKLPAGSGPLRIAHISDLHCDAKARLEDRLPEAIAALRPDLIVFTGDAVNAPAGLPVFRRCMERLAAIAPTLAVRGNWDMGDYRRLDFYGGTGVVELTGQAVERDLRGVRLCIEGASVGDGGAAVRAVAAVDRGMFTALLYHYGDVVEDVAPLGNVDLLLAGHTHGGQVALPFYGALITFAKFGKRYESGLYRLRDTWLYVNRGIGMEGGAHTPRVRFCARPEVTLIELSPPATAGGNGEQARPLNK